jgi:hypothetical protein
METPQIRSAPPISAKSLQVPTSVVSTRLLESFNLLFSRFLWICPETRRDLNNSNIWVEYDGISNHKKVLDSNANFEEFDVTSTDKKLRVKGQTLRLYNPTSHQWSIYLVDVDNGTLGLPAVVGQFTGNRGEFFDQEDFKGRAILVRYVWLSISPSSAHMEQSFSPDGGKTWEVNWICELSR